MVLSPGEAAKGSGAEEGPPGLPRGLSEAAPGRPWAQYLSRGHARRGEAPALSRLAQAASVPGILALGRSLGMGSPWALTVSRVSSEGRMWPQCSPGLPVHLCLPSTAPSQAYVHCCSLRGPVL